MKRIRLEQADWHVTARGARRLALFHDDADFKIFFALLGESCLATGMGLIAHCLMSNHFHLALSGGSQSLTRCMHRLNRAYSGYHNQRYGLSGHAFDREYYGEPIPSDFILCRVIRYIHLNPSRSSRSIRPEAYPWSSYRRMISGDIQTLSNEERRFILKFDSRLTAAQTKYRDFTEKDLIRRPTIPAGRTSAWEIWQEQFNWILEHAIEHEDSLDPLAPDLVAVHLGSRAGIPPRAMARVLSLPDGRRVSEMIRTLARRLDRSPSLKSRIDRLQVL